MDRFTETLWPTLLVAGVGFVGLVLFGRGMEHGRRARLWLGWLAAVAGLYALQALIVTPREHIRERFGVLVGAVKNEDARRFRAMLAADYQHDDQSADELAAWVEQRLKTLDILDVTVTAMEVSESGDGYEQTVATSAMVRMDAGFVGRVRSEWRLSWRRAEGGAVLTAIAPLKLEDQRVESLRELPR